MPGPMPYYLEKGYTLSVLESYLNRATHQEMLARFGQLTADAAGNYMPLVDTAFFNTPSLDFTETYAGGAQVTWTAASWKQHMNEHWFGRVDANGNAVNPMAAHARAQATSWWIDYWGEDVEGIVRRALVLAIKTAYQVGDEQELPEEEPNGGRWPIDVFWKCGQAWVEGWVTWRRLPGDPRGVVTLLLCTPPENTGKHVLWWSPVPPAIDSLGRADPYDLGLTGLGQAQAGMVVVTHERNLPVGFSSRQIQNSQKGKLVPPMAGTDFHGEGEVVAVQPALARGGASSTQAPQWQAATP